MLSARQGKAGLLALVLGIVNFAAFVLISLWIGGDALNGHTLNGHYFLSNHGQLTETTRVVFLYSEIHACSLFLSGPITLIGAAIFRQWKKQNELADRP